MAQGISIHAVDVSRGLVARGMIVEVFALEPERHLLCRGETGEKGTLEHPTLARRFEPGRYEIVFHVADWYRREGVALPAIPFLDRPRYRFGLAEPDQHHHFPFKMTPWGYSLFRGGV